MKDTNEKESRPEEQEAQAKEELNKEELEQVDAGSWLGMIWNKIKSFGP